MTIQQKIVIMKFFKQKLAYKKSVNALRVVIK